MRVSAWPGVRGAGAAAVFALGMSALSPSAVAFHGTPFQAEGEARVPGFLVPGQTLDAFFDWSGAEGNGEGTATVELRDPGSGDVLHRNTFSARETVDAVVMEDDCVEILQPYRVTSGPPVAGAPVALNLQGGVQHNLCNGALKIGLGGRYMAVVALDLRHCEGPVPGGCGAA